MELAFQTLTLSCFSPNLSTFNLKPNPGNRLRVGFALPSNKKPRVRTKKVVMEAEYDRAKVLKQFEDSKAGVKGLVDSGLTTIPRFFIHPQETLSDLKPKTRPENEQVEIPTIDLSGVDSVYRRSSIIDQIKRAASTFGFFQIINHGVPLQLLNGTVDSIKAFHEQPEEIRGRVYRRDLGTGVSYLSNIDLFHAKAASWRDTIQIRLGPTPPEYSDIPEICRDAVIEWDREMVRLGENLMGLMCEGLGLDAGSLKELTCGEGRVMAGHYYPYCPQPDLTIGLTSHTDPGILTVVLQDRTGGLQVKYGGDWVDVKPVPGALVINVGDLLQIISNDEYKSVEHRVLANPHQDRPRVSSAVFLNPSIREKWYGPFPQLISPEKPAVYRQFTYDDFMRRFFTKELDGKSLPNFYRI